MSEATTEKPPRRTISDTDDEPRGHPARHLIIPGDRGSGAIYLLRTVEQNHMHLSSMADTKANILIGACAVIFSVLLGYLHREGYSLPVAVLLVFTLMSAATAIMSVMPKVKGPPPGSTFFNPLFFGCFCQLDAEEYCKQMEKVLQNDSTIYTAMAMDIYGMGLVLYRKKYRYLMYSYRIFLTGLFAAFIAVLFSTME